MKQMNFLLCCLLLSAVVVAQDELGVEILSRGPDVTLNLNWYPSECDRNLDGNEDNNKKEKEYTVQLCDASDHCAKFKADPGRKISITNANFPLYFWSTYNVTVEVNCGFPINWIPHAMRIIKTGPGELPPPKGVKVTPLNTTATIEWDEALPEIQKAVSYLGVVICDVECYSEELIAKENPDYKRLNLEPGVQYSASVRYIDVYKKYESQYTNVSFETLPPPESKFPKVENFDVKIIENSDDTDIEVTYSMPSEHLETFWGVEVGVSSFQGKFLPGIVRSDGKVIKIESLPKFLNPTVHIYALYKVSGLTVKSVELTQKIHTGIGIIEKPTIDNLFAISDTEAVVEWSHSAKESDEFLYQIQWGKDSWSQVSLGKVNYFSIDGLSPQQTYNITVKAYIYYGEKDNQEYQNSSDAQVLTTLSKDALAPKLKVDKITVLDIQVSWDVELPTKSSSNCTYTISVCPDEKDCHFYTDLPFDQKSMNLEDYPLRYHNVSMWTKCRFYDTITVSKSSETIRVFTIFTPSPVKIETHRAVSETSLRISFTPGDPFEVRMIGEYEVQYMESDHEETLLTTLTQEDFITLDNLKTATNYNVSVSAIIEEKEFKRFSPPVYIIVSTLAPSPEEIKNFNGKQVAHTPNLQLIWDGPDYKYGGIKYSIKIECGKTVPIVEIDTNDTTVTVPVTSHEVENTFDTCEVLTKVVTTEQETERSSDISQQRVSFQTYGPPLQIDVTTPMDYSYIFDITPPKVIGASNFTYQVWRTGRFNESFDVFTDRPELNIPDLFTNVDVKARICVEELCGESKSLSFYTNVGIPSNISSVTALNVEMTNVRLFWSKPSTPNGPIDGYVITIIDSETKEKQIFNASGHESNFLYTSDKEHAEYELYVHAFNNDLYMRGLQRHGLDTMAKIQTYGNKAPPPKQFNINNEDQIINWNDPSEAGFKVLYYHLVLTSSSGTSYDVVLNETQFSFETLDPVTEYSAQISGCTAESLDSCGRPSAQYKFKTDVGEPSKPIVEVVTTGATAINIRWLKPNSPKGPIDGYTIAHGKLIEDSDPSDWITLSKEQPYYAYMKLEQDTEYIIRVKAFNKDFKGINRYSEAVTVYATTHAPPSESTIYIVVGCLCALSLALGLFVGYTRWPQIKRRFTRRSTVPDRSGFTIDLPDE